MQILRCACLLNCDACFICFLFAFSHDLDFTLQVIGVSVYGLLVVAFYTFLGPFIGNRVAQNTLLTLFTFSV